MENSSFLGSGGAKTKRRVQKFDFFGTSGYCLTKKIGEGKYLEQGITLID
jgi:hypothetical protein